MQWSTHPSFPPESNNQVPATRKRIAATSQLATGQRGHERTKTIWSSPPGTSARLSEPRKRTAQRQLGRGRARERGKRQLREGGGRQCVPGDGQDRRVDH